MSCTAAPSTQLVAATRGNRSHTCSPAALRMPACKTRSVAATIPFHRHGRASSVTARASIHAGGPCAPARPAAAPAPPPVRQFDFVVIGSGIAGLSYALKVAPYGTVAVITKDGAFEGSTRYAQGGVCAVLDPLDSIERHAADTMVAGAFLNDPKAVDVVCREGPARVLELVELGADFARNPDGTLHLTREGGHSGRRVVHAADLTGAEIERALLAAAKAAGGVSFFEHHLAIDLVTGEAAGAPHCFGVDALDTRANRISRFLGLSTMLASGGAGQLYPTTTNPAVATGDGVAMAYRAGAAVSNMEFVQFHPTALHSPPRGSGGRGSGGGAGGGEGRTFLISEAVRGEGGVLLNARGERFMSKYDSRLELAPRDVVARAIQDQMASLGSEHVWLDISHKPRGELLSHFPNIAARCLEDGVDITKDPIPVLLAQHYMCGGVAAGLLAETGVQGLYACGEVACSGLHGANRLASNSLLEGLVFADRAAGPSVAHAEYALRHCGRQLQDASAAGGAGLSGPRAVAALPAGPLEEWAAGRRAELRGAMWRAAGIVRRGKEMAEALGAAQALGEEARGALACHGASAELVELRNLATVAELVLASALQRRESRGLHCREDFPGLDPAAAPSVVSLAARPGGCRDAVGDGGAGRSAAVRASSPGPNSPAAGRAPGAGAGGCGAVDGPKGGARPASAPRDVAARSTPQDQE